MTQFGQHLGWAVVDDDGFLMQVMPEATLDDAFELAQHRFGDVLVDSVYYDVVGVGEPELLAANVRLPMMPAKALKASRVGRIDDRAVERMSLEEAHERFVAFLPKTRERAGRVQRLKVWADLDYAIRNLLRGNVKQDKIPEGTTVDGREPRAIGLSLAPNAIAFHELGQTSPPGAGRPQGDQSRTFCAGSNAFCRAGCLVYSGHQATDPYNLAIKVGFSKALLGAPVAFAKLLHEAIRWRTTSGRKARVEYFVRLNVLSDLPWELIWPELFERLGDVCFYDYTKVAGREPPPNYDLTFSYSGTNWRLSESELAAGRRCAVVFFADRAGKRFPETWRGYRVVPGDDHDIRPLDPPGVVVGLNYKTPNVEVMALRGRVPKAMAAKSFLVPVWLEDGEVIAAETPRSADAFWYDRAE